MSSWYGYGAGYGSRGSRGWSKSGQETKLVEHMGRQRAPVGELVEPEAGELLFLRRSDWTAEVQSAEQMRRQRIQELETLVEVLGESESLADYRQKATEELEMLKKKGVDKRPLGQQVASMDIWIKREEVSIRKNQEEMDEGL